MLRWKKIILGVLLTFLVLAAVSIILCNRIISNTAAGKLYEDADAISYRKTGLLLGTGKYLSNGSVNPYYAYRIAAASELMKKGRIKYLVISGDNSRNDYNEPEQMRQDLIREGIDSTHIYLDYAGFRTFDSMIRLKKIFGQESVTVISQKFHNERAIYLAGKCGISAIGFNARDVSGNKGWKVQLREKLARVKVFLDQAINQQPKFLGDKIAIPE